MSTVAEARTRGAQREVVSRGVFLFCAILVIVLIFAIFIFVGSNAFQTFTLYHKNPFDLLFGTKYSPDQGNVGAFVPIAGTFIVTVFAVILSAPVAIGIALFVSEIAPEWAQRLMQPVLELLTGIPSIIYGLLGIQLVVPFVARVYNSIAGFFAFNGFGLVAAAIVLSIMILPTITTLSIDSLRAVPGGVREASLALGATRWQTIYKAMIPGASSGIFTGIVLGMGRAIGETLAVAFVIGGATSRLPFGWTNEWPFIKFYPTSTITVQLLHDFGEATNPSLTYSVIWTLSFILLMIALCFVLLSRWLQSRSVYQPATTRAKR